ncbi:MAG TPA: serine/threonine-protein kinase, partial [Blastocatellia bacterium]|nr:serine/threonine-protein kinase [Blastocatellia bacterium]
MKPERWREIEGLYNSALEREPDARAAFLEQECAGDEVLRQEVESLLDNQPGPTGLLQAPVRKILAQKVTEDERKFIGRRLGNYEVLSRLGAGGMGEVYLAEDTKLNRKVAVKLLPAGLTEDERARKRFVREAKTAAALDHPNICSIYEVGEEAGSSFIVMQYVEGEALSDRIQRKHLELSESLDVAVQVADALAEAHSRRVIHRDIKPQNIMITARGNVKVLDFGLAKVTRERLLAEPEASTESLLSEPGSILGTIPYMSPEQVRGEQLDARTDIFSFGSVLYEMLAGRHPFAAESAATTLSAILTKQP